MYTTVYITEMLDFPHSYPPLKTIMSSWLHDYTSNQRTKLFYHTSLNRNYCYKCTLITDLGTNNIHIVDSICNFHSYYWSRNIHWVPVVNLSFHVVYSKSYFRFLNNALNPTKFRDFSILHLYNLFKQERISTTIQSWKENWLPTQFK